MIKCICNNVEEITKCKRFCDGEVPCIPLEPIQDGINKKMVKEVNMRSAVAHLIQDIDPDAGREGLIETPKRYVKFLREFTSPEPFNFTTFNEPGANEMVIVHDIPFYSLCEHHLAPFFGVGHIAYIPQNETIVGISKLPRVLDMFARRLQNQERICKQVAEYINEKLNPAGVGVILQARHMCVEMRGIKKAGAMTTTSTMLGRFKENINTRQEFLNLINTKR